MTSCTSIALRVKAKMKDFVDCKEAYRAMKAKSGVYSGVCEVKDTGKYLATEEDEDTSMQDVGEEDVQEEEIQVEEEIQDEAMQAEEDLLKLHEGSYDMEPTSLRCLIYKMDSIDAETFEMFSLLESVRHPTLVRHHTFYEESLEESVVPRIVLSGVDITFWELLLTDEASKMFFTETESGVSLKTELLTMILDLCSGLEHLFKLGLYPPKIGLDDLYLCKAGPKRYRLQLLILKVDKLATESDKNHRMAALWTQVKETVKEIREYTVTDEFNDVDGRFINYIGNDVSALAQYPLSWSYNQKGCYLISIISADKSVICDKLQNSGLKWANGDLPKLIELLINHDLERDHPSKYSTAVPYDYLLLCRTAYKHYPTLSKEVPELKDMCPKREDVLEKMEKWEPQIWCILYDAIGLIASL